MPLSNPEHIGGPEDVPGLIDRLMSLSSDTSNQIALKQSSIDQLTAAQQAATQTIQTQAGQIASLQTDLASVRSLIGQGTSSSAPVNTAAPSIVGSPTTLTPVSTTYTVTPGTWTGASTAPRNYKLLQGSVELLSFAGTTFTVPASAAGGTLTLVEYVASTGGITAFKASIGYAVGALPATPVMLTAPSLTGSFQAGGTVNIVNGTYNGGAIVSYTPYVFYVGGQVVQSGSSKSLVVTSAMAGLSIYATELPANSVGAALNAVPTATYTITGGSKPDILPGSPSPGWEDGTYAVGVPAIFNFGEWSNNPDTTLDQPGLELNGATFTGATITNLGDGRARVTPTTQMQGGTMVGTIIRSNSNGPSGVKRTGGRVVGAPVSGSGVVTPPTATGSISVALADSASTYAMSTLGTRNWWVRNGAGVLNQKSGGENVTFANITAGGVNLVNDSSNALPQQLSWASGGTPTASGSNIDTGSIYTGKATYWQQAGAGESYTMLASTTSRAYHLIFGIYSQTIQLVISLADGSAPSQTLLLHAAPLGATAYVSGSSVNREVTITFKADSTTTVNIAVTNYGTESGGTTANGNAHLLGGYTA